MKSNSFYRWILPPALLLAALLVVSCSEDRENPYTPHPEGWTDTHSERFHGWAAVKSDGIAGCRSCHGASLTGGEKAGSCYECHGYLHSSVTNGDVETHQRLIVDAGWNINRCANCHGSDFAGGEAEASCRTCHESTYGPAECGTCHSSPPMRTGETKMPFGIEQAAAGAHDVHSRFACTECHAPTGGLAHAGPLPADITFANANIATAEGAQPVFTHLGEVTSGEGTCSNVYCHSDGRGGAPVAMPQWVAGGLECGGCHRVAPESAPHNGIMRPCHQCHTNVDPNSNYAISDSIRFLDNSLHVNGAVE